MAAALSNAVANVLRSIAPAAGEDVDEGLGDAASKEVIMFAELRFCPSRLIIRSLAILI